MENSSDVIYVNQQCFATPRFRCLSLDVSKWEPTVSGLKCFLISETAQVEASSNEDALEFFFVVSDGRVVGNNHRLKSGKEYFVNCRVLGGKGGFGSLLRSFGSQISKNRNQDACRDLSGRRLRNVKAEERMKTLVEKQATKDAEKKKKKDEKIQKLKSALQAKPKHNFSNPAYEAERSQIPEKVFSAVEEGIKVINSNSGCTSTAVVVASSSTSMDGDKLVEAKIQQTSVMTSEISQKRKHVDPMEKDTKSKRMKGWLGIDDSDDSEEEKP